MLASDSQGRNSLDNSKMFDWNTYKEIGNPTRHPVSRFHRCTEGTSVPKFVSYSIVVDKSHGGARGKIMIQPKSVGFSVLEPWMFAQKVVQIQVIASEWFQSGPKCCKDNIFPMWMQPNHCRMCITLTVPFCHLFRVVVPGRTASICTLLPT